MLYEDNYLAHFGIKGQKWGIRRFQNEDGTLTEEGKRRYYDVLTDKQKKIYDNKMTDKQRASVMKKLSEGKSWTRAISEMHADQKKKTNLYLAGAALASYVGMLAVNGMLQKAAKATIGAIKGTKAAQHGALWLRMFRTRRDMIKKGAVVLKKSQYSVQSIPFGGYLK